MGTSGARAVGPDRLITADSLDVQMPNQKVNEVHAIGQAYAETTPDSTKLKSDQRDWLRGDTIVASFDSAAASDTSSRPRIRELLAIGRASSFYQVASNKGRTAPPSLNYVRGRYHHRGLRQPGSPVRRRRGAGGRRISASRPTV